jgi:hypothetical protein
MSGTKSADRVDTHSGPSRMRDASDPDGGLNITRSTRTEKSVSFDRLRGFPKGGPRCVITAFTALNRGRRK